jgi:hypothetical protein
MSSLTKLAPALLLVLLAACGSSGGTGSPDAGGADGAGHDGATQDANPGSEAGTDGASPDGGGGDGATPACVTAADCPSGQVCITHDNCLPPPAPPGCSTTACAPDPCAGQALSCMCAGCGFCSVDPDAGTIFCGSGG